ncbi:hypothetical protein KC347_g123 [Hortaea werneckii]|nr:hypothetical protein KC347_g123 [Hortaea werneckii]
MPQTLELSAKARALRFTLRTTLAPPNVRMVEEAGNTGPKSMSARFGSNDDGQAQDAQQGVVPVGSMRRAVTTAPLLHGLFNSNIVYAYGDLEPAQKTLVTIGDDYLHERFLLASGTREDLCRKCHLDNEDSRNATATWTEKAHRLPHIRKSILPYSTCPTLPREARVTETQPQNI